MKKTIMECLAIYRILANAKLDKVEKIEDKLAVVHTSNAIKGIVDSFEKTREDIINRIQGNDDWQKEANKMLQTESLIQKDINSEITKDIFLALINSNPSWTVSDISLIESIAN